MNYNSLKATINANVKQNGNQEITGIVMNSVLNAMVNALSSAGATFGGIITPTSSAPVSLDQATAFLAMSAGTYTNFRDSNNNPIVITCPSLIIYNGGDTLAFTTISLPVPQVLSVFGGNSLVIPISDSQNSYRIDMTAQYTGGSEERYIGSLILEVNDLAMQVAHGYYYGDDMAEILSEVAIWMDDPEIYPDEQGYYLLLTTQSDLDEVIFSVSSLDGQSVQMVESNEDEKVKVADATITPVGSGGGYGKIGVISQTQRWTTVPSVNAPGVYSMSDIVYGIIPQANIDLYEAAGATFNAISGYFELNGLTDISYNEMSAIYAQNVPNPWTNQQGMFTYSNIRTNIPPKNNIASVTAFSGLRLAYGSGKIERIVLKSNVSKVQMNNLQLAFFRLSYLSDVPDEIDVTNATNFTQAFESCYSLKEIRLYKLKASLSFAACAGLSKDSLLYMINNEAATSTIVITLHPSVYDKTQTGGEWKADVDAALANHPNVQLGQ